MMKNQTEKPNLSDQLKLEGINCKGFGIVSKFVMIDTDLTLCAKTIYAYLCSLAGNGTTAFPRCSTIAHHLNIGKDAYFKHFKLLKDNGYIHTKRSSIFPFGNIYTIVSNPKKQATAQQPKQKTSSSQLKHTGLKSMGFGILPRALMMDDRISWQSKGIYAYFCSFVGSGFTAFPSRELIKYHLNIGMTSYYKHFKQLIAVNYISVQQRKQDGRFGVNDYFLNDLPDEQVGAQETKKRKEQKQRQKPCITFQDNGTNPENSALVPSTAFTDNDDLSCVAFTDNDDLPCVAFRDTAITGSAIADNININNTTKNKNKKNNPSISQARSDLMDQKTHTKKIIQDRITYEQIIKENIEYDLLKSRDDATLEPYLDMLVETMLDAITATVPLLRINGSDLPQDIVKSRLLKLDEDHIKFVSLSLHQSNTKIKNIKNYILTALYNSFTNMNLFYAQWVKSNLAK